MASKLGMTNRYSKLPLGLRWLWDDTKKTITAQNITTAQARQLCANNFTPHQLDFFTMSVYGVFGPAYCWGEEGDEHLAVHPQVLWAWIDLMWRGHNSRAQTTINQAWVLKSLREETIEAKPWVDEKLDQLEQLC